jgi:energy-coupling factor transport system substrate-specific component
MPSPTPQAKTSLQIRRLVLSALMGALLVVSKQAMSGLPNIEPVSFLIVLYTLELPHETPGAITVFLLLQGLLYGFGLWWFMYIYVWYLLALIVWLLRRLDHAFLWACVSGLYGLAFGGLCAAVYLVAKTPAFALSWWLSGLSYDALHGVGNFVIMLLLYRPMRRALQLAKKQLRV